DCGVPCGQFPALKPVLVQASESVFTSPAMAATPRHPEGPSNDMYPTNEPVPVRPLIAPDHSGGTVAHAPSTQFTAVWNASRAMVRAGKLDDSSVPDHTPARFATSVGKGVGLGVL